MTILGLDISKWDGNWNAAKTRSAGATFVFIKSSQATFTDPKFRENWQKAKEAGLLRGAYHYLDYTKPGADQANYMAELLRADPGELPPVIDYEQRRSDNNPGAALAFLREFLDTLTNRKELFEDAAVKFPMIYTGPAMWAEYGDKTKREYWIQFPLWLAHWTTSSAPLVPSPWPMWHFWQFTDKGPGEAFGTESLAIDMNRFNGTLGELLEFAGVHLTVANLNEEFAVLTKKVNDLQSLVAAGGGSGTPNATGLTERLDGMDQRLTSLGSTVTSLTASLAQRLAVVEQKVAGSGSTTTNPGTGTTTEPLPTGNELYATCINSALNVRSGPGVTYEIVGGLKYGQKVKVLKRQNGWAQLESPAGWSSEAYLTFSSTGTVSQEQPQTSTGTYGICNTSGLNVRSGPGVSYPIVGGLTYGQRVKIVTRKNGWAQLESPAGWSNECYLSFA